MVLARLVVRVAVLAVILSLVGSGHAVAQIPDKFENLKVLPKDISKRELVAAMRSFASALGVRCKHCHVPGDDPATLEGYDFKSDKPEHKAVARKMLKMVQAINEEHIAKTGIESPTRVQCITCHRGLEDPRTLDHILIATVEEDGRDAAIEKYKMLHTKYYGSGSYDFKPRTLNSVAETLAGEKKDYDTAIALMKLSLEYDPEEASSHMLLGQIYAAKGDKDAAIASLERSLEIEPDNRWAKRLLEQVRSKK